MNVLLESLRTMQAIILCGGKGTRLNTLYSDRPKILVPIAGRSFLEWQLEWLARNGVRHVHLAAGHQADVLRAWMWEEGVRCQASGVRRRMDAEERKSRSSFDLVISGFVLSVSLSVETVPLGTAGGLKFVEPFIQSDPFLVLNGDSLSPNFDFVKLMEAHRGRSSGVSDPGYGAPRPSSVAGLAETGLPGSAIPAKVTESRGAATIAVTRIDEAGRYGAIEFDDSGLVTAFREKAQRESGWINTGVYLLDRTILASIPPGRNLSLETDVYPDLVHRGVVHACPIAPPMLDMGTPEGIRAMEAYLGRRKVET